MICDLDEERIDWRGDGSKSLLLFLLAIIDNGRLLMDRGLFFIEVMLETDVDFSNRRGDAAIGCWWNAIAQYLLSVLITRSTICMVIIIIFAFANLDDDDCCFMAIDVMSSLCTISLP